MVTLALVGLPATAAAQSDEGTRGAAPMARRPDGALPLEGTPWRLRAYRYKGIDREPGPEVAARMTLADGRLEASGGCTAFRGNYGQVGAAISFSLKRLQKNDCAEQTTVVQLGLQDGLRKAASYEIRRAPGAGEDELVLRDASGQELLRFGLDEIGALGAAEWRLESYTTGGARVAAMTDLPAVASFRVAKENEARRYSSGRLSASSGCNAIVGEFFRHADVMSLGELDSTGAPCSETAQAQEDAIVAVLDATALRVELRPDHLRLTSADSGDTLEYVSTQPLEGSTWVLAKSRATGSGTPVALWFDGGTAGGEGPCGPISGSYVSDGLFLTFADISGAGDVDCAAAEAEKNILAALRATVLLDRDQAQLRFLDARGRVVARLKAPTGP